jgi:hypothetical protein
MSITVNMKRTSPDEFLRRDTPRKALLSQCYIVTHLA